MPPSARLLPLFTTLALALTSQVSAAETTRPAWIEALAPGQWQVLPNTKIRSVLPPTPQQGDPRSIVLAWSGGTVDTVKSRLLVWGGGHSDYWGNELYALDIGTKKIKRITDPSPDTPKSNCRSALPDGQPVSRHTYGGMAYIAHAKRLFQVNGSLVPCGYQEPATWTYDFPQKKWHLMIPDFALHGFGTMAVYDAQTKQVFVKDNVDFYAYTLETNKYRKLNTTEQFVDYHLSAAIDSKRRQFVMIGDGVQVIDLATNKMTTMATTNAPKFVTSQQSPGIAYDPVADRIVAWHGGSKVHALNMDTGAWTQVATNAGPTAAAPYQGTFGRWGYVPEYGVFALVNDIDQNAWIFKLH
jgi:hypothetical protein